ncbi:MAG: exo-alpha-sialidase [Paracoccaceae bacterium]
MADILVGTTKGLFVLEDRGGRRFRLKGPFCDGWPINHAVGDAATGRIWAAGGNGWTGAGVWRQTGGDWAVSQGPFEGAEALWSLAMDPTPGQDRLLAGSKPAYLFESRDEGQSWRRLEALTDQPGADSWMPGAAGLTLHTILCDGKGGVWVGISAAGVFESRDGGQSWAMRNRRGNRPGPAGALEREWEGEEFRREDEIMSCVHNLAFGAAEGLIYMQNHQGVYRSRDGGAVWEEVTEGLPSTFGFPVAAHPRDPGVVWVFPLNGDRIGRWPVDGSALVWKSRDGGESWAPKGQGLPARDCFFTVLRQGMAVDGDDPCGVVFGTNSGSVFFSRDEGESWEELARHLPTVLSVEMMR